MFFQKLTIDNKMDVFDYSLTSNGLPQIMNDDIKFKLATSWNHCVDQNGISYWYNEISGKATYYHGDTLWLSNCILVELDPEIHPSDMPNYLEWLESEGVERTRGLKRKNPC